MKRAAEFVKPNVRAARPADVDYRLQLLRRFNGKPSLCDMDSVGNTANTQRKPYMVKERVAIVEIYGVLTNDAWYYDETGYDEIQNEVAVAADDADVDAVLLAICSPGGETDNAFETADMVASLAKKKPTYAVAAPWAYSAAYLLASQSNLIYTPKITGGVGSIGVYALHMDYSGYLSQLGIKATFISAGKGKTDGNPYEPLSEEAFKKMKAEVNRLYGEFVSRVASGRKLSESAIIKLGAELFDGSKAALGAGLADRAGSPETAFVDLATQLAAAKLGVSPAFAAAQPQGEHMDSPNPAQPAAAVAQPPSPAPPAAAPAPAGATATQLTEEARRSSESEASQIANLCKIAGKPALAVEFLTATPRKTVAQVSEALLELRAKENAGPGEVRNGVLGHQASETTKPQKSLAQLQREKGEREGWFKK